MLRLLDDQWERIREHFPEERIPDCRPGRKPIPTRVFLEAVLWILNPGAQSQFLLQCYPNYKTVHRRFHQWCQREVLRDVLTQLVSAPRDEGAIDERESFIDATSAAVKGGGDAVGLTKRGKGVTILAIMADIPYCLPRMIMKSPSPAQFRLLYTVSKSAHLSGDRAYDSDELNEELKHNGMNLISPHRSTCILKTQATRHLCRHKRHWVVDRFFVWLEGTRLLLMLGALRRQTPRVRAARLHHDITQAIWRLVLRIAV